MKIEALVQDVGVDEIQRLGLDKLEPDLRFVVYDADSNDGSSFVKKFWDTYNYWITIPQYEDAVHDIYIVWLKRSRRTNEIEASGLCLAYWQRLIDLFTYRSYKPHISFFPQMNNDIYNIHAIDIPEENDPARSAELKSGLASIRETFSGRARELMDLLINEVYDDHCTQEDDLNKRLSKAMGITKPHLSLVFTRIKRRVAKELFDV